MDLPANQKFKPSNITKMFEELRKIKNVKLFRGVRDESHGFDPGLFWDDLAKKSLENGLEANLINEFKLDRSFAL